MCSVTVRGWRLQLRKQFAEIVSAISKRKNVWETSPSSDREELPRRTTPATRIRRGVSPAGSGGPGLRRSLQSPSLLQTRRTMILPTRLMN